MIKKKLIEKNIQLYGLDFKKWPIEMPAAGTHLLEQTIKQDAYLMGLVLREAKFNQLLQMLSAPDPVATLEKNIYQTAMADTLKLPKPHHRQRFIYSRSTIRLWQKRLGSLVTMSVSLVAVFAYGWGVGTYYQQPTFEITDFYTDPAVSMIFEE